MSLSVVPFRTPPADVQPTAEQFSLAKRVCAFLALASGVSGYLRFGISRLFAGAAVLRGVSTAACIVLALWLLYWVASLIWLWILWKRNGAAPPASQSNDESIDHLIFSRNLSGEASLMDLRMNSVDFYVIPSPGISGSLGQILHGSDRTESSKCEGVNGRDDDVTFIT